MGERKKGGRETHVTVSPMIGTTRNNAKASRKVDGVCDNIYNLSTTHKEEKGNKYCFTMQHGNDSLVTTFYRSGKCKREGEEKEDYTDAYCHVL